jgi:hypothetical protein
MIAILPRTNNAWVFVEGKSNVGFEGQPGAFEDDLGVELVTRLFSWVRLTRIGGGRAYRQGTRDRRTARKIFFSLFLAQKIRVPERFSASYFAIVRLLR